MNRRLAGWVVSVAICAVAASGGCGNASDDSGQTGQQQAEQPWKDVDSLIKQLEDPNPLARAMAAMNLGNKGEAAKKAVPALEELRNDPDAKVREAAEKALNKLQQ